VTYKTNGFQNLIIEIEQGGNVNNLLCISFHLIEVLILMDFGIQLYLEEIVNLQDYTSTTHFELSGHNYSL
jgi:hypothetical protein